MNKPTLNACLKNKRIYLNRVTITLLGSPSHLSFWYDEEESLLYIAATRNDDLAGYAIPKFFWNSSRSCEIARIIFFRALQYRLNWEDGSKYSYVGILTVQEGVPAIVFNMNDGKKTRIRNTGSRNQRDGCNLVASDDKELSRITQKIE